MYVVIAVIVLLLGLIVIWIVGGDQNPNRSPFPRLVP